MSLCVASACLPIVALADSELVPAATNDPIFAAIEEHKKSWANYESRAREYSVAEVAADMPRVKDSEVALGSAWDQFEASSWELCRVSIFSLAGAAALLQYAADHIAAGGSWPNVERDWNLTMHQQVATALERFALGHSRV